MVTETPEIYRDYVRPYMSAQREEGRLNWVFNILEGRTEQEDVILRDAGEGPDDGFLMLPDLNWDRKTMSSLHLLALVQRRDIWSLRDLKKKHIPWLRYLRKRLLEGTVKMYPELEEDQLKLYVHCKCCSLGLPWFARVDGMCTNCDARPTDLLPLPHPRGQRYARGGCDTSNRESLWSGKSHFSTGDSVWGPRCKHGGCQFDILPRRGQRAVDKRLLSTEKGIKAGSWKLRVTMAMNDDT